MDVSTQAAIASAGVSGIGAVIAVWQSVSARGSAKSAQRQAVAAEQQVAIMRAQLNADEEARRQASRPVFSVPPGFVSWEDANYPCGKLVVRQTGGVALGSVVARVSGDYIKGFFQGEPSGLSEVDTLSSVDIGPMSIGTDAEIYVRPEWEHVTPLRVMLELTSQRAKEATLGRISSW